MKKILVCTNFRSNPQHASCGARGSELLVAKLSAEIDQSAIKISPCMGFCDIGPNIRLTPDGRYIHGLTSEKLELIMPEIRAFIAD